MKKLILIVAMLMTLVGCAHGLFGDGGHGGGGGHGGHNSGHSY